MKQNLKDFGLALVFMACVFTVTLIILNKFRFIFLDFWILKMSNDRPIRMFESLNEEIKRH